MLSSAMGYCPSSCLIECPVSGSWHKCSEGRRKRQCLGGSEPGAFEIGLYQVCSQFAPPLWSPRDFTEGVCPDAYPLLRNSGFVETAPASNLTLGGAAQPGPARGYARV